MLNLLEVLVIVHLHLKMFPQTVEILYQAFIQKQNKKGGWVGGWGGGGGGLLACAGDIKPPAHATQAC